MSDPWRAAGPRLVPGRDLHIIGCRRRTPSSAGGSCLGLRWASRIDLGFPTGGYRVARLQPAEQLGTFFLPDTSGWQAFAKDAELRRPRCGPYFERFEEDDFGDLLPVIRFCDPRAAAGETAALIERAAAFFGDTHRADAGLAVQFWHFRPVPELSDLLADPTAAAALERFYRRQCLGLIHVLALRFEYAALFGLATDDDRSGQGIVTYQVQAIFAAGYGSAQSDPVPTNALCAPMPPTWLTAERVPGGVLHPAATLWPEWHQPPELQPTDEQGNPLPLSAGWPRVPAALTGLAWAEPASEPKLIGHGPVLYRVSRCDYGPASAALATAPMLPAGAVFTRLGDGEDLIRGPQEPHFIDRPGMPWPPLEGHYVYEVKGVDLLGVASAAGTRASIRHHDDVPPPAPRASTSGQVAVVAANVAHVDVPLRIDWDAAEDFGGPDVVEFRVAFSFRNLRSLQVQVESVADAGPLHADLVVASLPVAAESLDGALLSLANGEFPIVGNGSGAHAALRVRKPRGRVPRVGDTGLVLAPSAPMPVTRLARLPRRPMVSATVVGVPSLDPLAVELAPAGASAITDDDALSIYLHLLGASFSAERVGSSTFRLAPPRPDTPVEARWSAWLGLSDSAAALIGSPVLLFPQHELVASVPLPAGFTAGTLSLHVTAADGAAYVASPLLPVADPALANARGNESGRAVATLSVRSLALPPAVDVEPFDPQRRVWARSAATYAEDATYGLSWPAAAGAARYEVWRALEGAVPGATKATPDADLRALAAAEGKFALRSDRVFATSFVDGIPGRAPVRALYRVRAVSTAGIVGPFSAVIGPIYVPDVRPPAAPNLLRVAPVPPEDAEGAILVEWAGLTDADTRFEVWFSEAGGPGTPMQLAGMVSAGSPAGADGRYSFIHGGRRPARLTVYEVRAVREALDPIDAEAVARRDIASLPSRRLSAAALRSSPFVAPSLTAAEASAAGVLISWTIADEYGAIEVRRRAPDRFGFQTIARLGGDATSFLDPIPPAGTYRYQLRAIGPFRAATGDEITVEVA